MRLYSSVVSYGYLNDPLRILTEIEDDDGVPDSSYFRVFSAGLLAAETLVSGPRVDAALQRLNKRGMIHLGRRGWLPTEAGCAWALRVRPAYTRDSLTKSWVDHRVDEIFIDKIIKFLTAKCTISVSFGEIRELLDDYLAALMSRNGLATMISDGRAPQASQVQYWVYKSALSKWRNEGRDAQTRSFKGSRTERDLQYGGEADVVKRSMPTPYKVIVTEDVDAGTQPMMEITDGSRDDVATRLDWEVMMGRMACVLANSKQPQMFNLFQRVEIDRDDPKEIAREWGMSETRMTILLRQVRRKVKEEGARMNTALKVLKYLEENPYSTIEDLREPPNEDPRSTEGGVGSDVSADVILFLTKRGVITKAPRGSYLVTPLGHTVGSVKDFLVMKEIDA